MAAVAGGLLAAPRITDGQRPYRIGLLVEGPQEGFVDYQKLIESTFRGLGYIDKQNVRFEYRFAGGQTQQLPRLARELTELPVDVLLAPSNSAIGAAREATSVIPIVMIMAADPVRAKFVETLSRPGTNVTGLTGDAAPETIVGKQVGLLREVAPRLSRLAILWNPDFPVYRDYVRDASSLVKGLSIHLQAVETRVPPDIREAFVAMHRNRADAVIVMPDDFTFTHRRQIGDLAAQHRIPTMCYFREFVEAGCLMCYGVNISSLYRRAPIYVHRILKGAKPADLPVEQPTVFEMVINLKTGRALGLTVPQSLLARADQVIE